MKNLRLILVFLIAAMVAGVQPADAQFRSLRNKLKKKVEDKVEQAVEERVERRIDQEMDKAIGKTVDSIADDMESSISGLLFSSDPPPPIELGDNQTGPSDAPYVTYTMASRISMGIGGLAEKLLNKHGATSETVYTHDDRQRTDSEKSSSVMDAGGRRRIGIDHEKKEYWIMSFDDMMKPLEQLSETTVADASPDTEEGGGSIKEMKVSIERRGEQRTINGVPCTRMVAVVEADYEISAQNEETGEVETVQGKSYTVIDQWHSSAVAGYGTIAGFQKAMWEAFQSSMGEGGMSRFIESMKSAPQMKESTAKAFEEMGDVEGLPVRSSVHMVQVPPDGKFDLDAVLAEGPRQISDDPSAQRTVLTVLTEIGDLTTAPFDEGLLDVPSSEYSEIESPMKKAMEQYQQRQ